MFDVTRQRGVSHSHDDRAPIGQTRTMGLPCEPRFEWELLEGCEAVGCVPETARDNLTDRVWTERFSPVAQTLERDEVARRQQIGASGKVAPEQHERSPERFKY